MWGRNGAESNRGRVGGGWWGSNDCVSGGCPLSV